MTLRIDLQAPCVREGFGLKVACILCISKNRINIEREGAKSGQEQQTKKNGFFLQLKRLPAVDIGTKVVVRVPDLDRGRLAPRNVLAVVVDVSYSGLYLFGTKEGLLEWLYARSRGTTADISFIEAHDVPSSSLSLRSASMMTSGSKQGFVSCRCKRYCIDKNCKFRSKNMKFKLQAPRFLYIGQAFLYSPENTFYLFNQQIYFII